MRLLCAHCGTYHAREDFRVQIPKKPVVDAQRVRQAFITHKRCGVTTVVRESMARNLRLDAVRV